MGWEASGTRFAEFKELVKQEGQSDGTSRRESCGPGGDV